MQLNLDKMCPTMAHPTVAACHTWFLNVLVSQGLTCHTLNQGVHTRTRHLLFHAYEQRCALPYAECMLTNSDARYPMQSAC